MPGRGRPCSRRWPGLGLVVLWDEGDDLHAEPRAPYPHAREVLALRAHRARSAALIGGFARTAEAAQLIAAGWARPLDAGRAVVRQFAPAVHPAGDGGGAGQGRGSQVGAAAEHRAAHGPGSAGDGPVLFQVPRRGYLAAVACERCHARARCSCGGPAELPGPAGAAALRLVRLGDRPQLPPLRPPGPARAGHRCPPDR